MHDLRSHRFASGTPALVTGSHRSGTTWVADLIGRSASYVTVYEPYNILLRGGWMPSVDRNWYSFPSTDPRADTLDRELDRMMSLRYSWAAAARGLANTSSKRATLRGGFNSFAGRTLRRSPLIKDPLLLLAAPHLADRYDMRVLVTVRHPAAFAQSLIDADWPFAFSHFAQQNALMSGPFRDHAREIADAANATYPIWHQAALLWRLLYGFVLEYLAERQDTIVVRHEDVIDAPVDQFVIIQRHLGYVSSRSYLRGLEHLQLAGQARRAQDSRRWTTMIDRQTKTNIRSIVDNVSDNFYDHASWGAF